MTTLSLQYHLHKSRAITTKFEIIYTQDKKQGIKYLLKTLSKQPDKIKYMTTDGIVKNHPELKGKL